MIRRPPGQLIRQGGGGGREAALCQQQAQCAGGDGQQQRLHEQLLENAPASRAQSGADCQLLAARERPREEQVAGIGAGDQQHQCDSAQQHHQRQPEVADDDYTALTMLKMAVFAPMPSARTATTARANDGVRDRIRSA